MLDYVRVINFLLLIIIRLLATDCVFRLYCQGFFVNKKRNILAYDEIYTTM